MSESIIKAICLVNYLGLFWLKKLLLFHESPLNDLKNFSYLLILREDVNFTIHVLDNIWKSCISSSMIIWTMSDIMKLDSRSYLNKFCIQWYSKQCMETTAIERTMESLLGVERVHE